MKFKHNMRILGCPTVQPLFQHTLYLRKFRSGFWDHSAFCCCIKRK